MVLLTVVKLQLEDSFLLLMPSDFSQNKFHSDVKSNAVRAFIIIILSLSEILLF